MNLLTVLTLLGAAHGVFLSLALLNTTSGDVIAHRILSVFTLLFAIDLGEEYLFQTGFFELSPHLLQILAPLDLCYGPVLYIYVCHLASSRSHKWSAEKLRHFVAPFVGLLLMIPFYLNLNGSQKAKFVDLMRIGELTSIETPLSVRFGVIAFGFLTVVQIGIYLFLSVQRVRLHYQNIQQEFSNLEKINLEWLRNLLLGLSLIYICYLFDQIYPNMLGLNLFGDLVTVLAVVLIYLMGYLGLKQPRIFAEVKNGFNEIPTNEFVKPNDTNVQSRYKRSGIDPETSHTLLNELTNHMEKNKPYLKAGLTSSELAAQLGITTNYLSQIVNEQKQLNFHDFVNKYRIEEAKRLVLGPDKINVLHIAFESGFNSKSAFYSAFKKATGMTPTQYRKNTNELTSKPENDL